MRSTLSVLAAALLALAASAGCGDDEPAAEATTAAPPTSVSTEAATTTAPTATEDYARPEPPPDQSGWAARVDEACEPVQRQIDALPPPSDAASLESWVEQVVPLVREEVAAVKAVEPPAAAEEAGDARLFVESLERLGAALTRYLDGLRDADQTALQQALADANAAGTDARTHALSLGVTECGGYSGS